MKLHWWTPTMKSGLILPFLIFGCIKAAENTYFPQKMFQEYLSNSLARSGPIYAQQSSAIATKKANKPRSSSDVSNQDIFSFHRSVVLPDISQSFSDSSDVLSLDSSFGFTSSEETSESLCRNLSGLSDYQKQICFRNPGFIWALIDGTQLGLYECVHQFRMEKWNCSAAKLIYFIHTEKLEEYSLNGPVQSALASGNLINGLQAILKKGSRETAFISAVWASGAVQAITRACSRGRISTCDCDPFRREGKAKDSEGDFTWGGCSDPIRFGMQLTRQFLDAVDVHLRDRMNKRERELNYKAARIRRVRTPVVKVPRGQQIRAENGSNPTNANSATVRFKDKSPSMPLSVKEMKELTNIRLIKSRVLMDLHNRKAGRRLVWQNREKKCKCHGVSGACSLRTCWQRVSQFRQIGNMLKTAYQSAIYTVYDPGSGKVVRSVESFGKSFEVSEPVNWKNPFNWKLSKSQPVWLKSAAGNALKAMDKSIFLGDRSIRRYKDMLIYTESSPNYCNADPSIVHLGVAGRQCETGIKDQPNSCDNICCGRGYDTIETETSEKCDCKFVWCCEVKCRICHKKMLLHRCKSSREDDQISKYIYNFLNDTTATRHKRGSRH